MASLINCLPAIASFGVNSEPTNVGQRWQIWKKQLEYYIIACGVTDIAQKRALFLHLIGPECQEIFSTFTDTGDDFEGALEKFDAYFMPKKNIPFERHLFRQANQNVGETVTQFVTRLRKLADTCEFRDTKEDNIRDQVVEKCRSHQLRKRLLREDDLQLSDVLSIARAMEAADSQAEQIQPSTATTVNHDVCSIKSKQHAHYGRRNAKRSLPNKDDKQRQCYRCGRLDHFAKNCDVTRGKTCNKCGMQGHFAVMCKTKSTQHSKPNQNVRCVETNESDEFTFSVHTSTDNRKATIDVDVGGISINMLIDSGSSVNIISQELWETLKECKIKCTCNKSGKEVFAYGNTPLNVIGTFTAETKTNNTNGVEEYVVVSGSGRPLLGCKTSIERGILNFDHCNAVCRQGPLVADDVIQMYPECYDRFGKLKDYQLSLHIDDNIRPVAQPLRRIPYSMRAKVESKLDQLEEMDIIEKVTGPTKWVSPVVVVPKSCGEIRLCVDMRMANEAVIRERHPIPTVDEVLHDVNNAVMYSKLDLRWGYHQIELDPKSREITTFVTHKGIYRYKRLMFGISSAPEMYQHAIQQVLKNCEGVHNISDDILVYGTTIDEHNKRLLNVMEALKENGLTLNKTKCQIGVSEITFMGHLLSNRGIAPTAERVKAVKNTKTPQTAAEVSSFLGLVNFCSRFIPQLATVAEPMRKLTRKSAEFIWNEEQQQAFNKLKALMSDAEVLAHFDQNATTKLIVDASPVGLGAILAQKCHDDTFRVVCYASRSLTDVERRYSQTEKEALGIVWACEKYHMYLYGVEFELETDHRPLEVIYSRKSKPPSARIERWVLRLQPYNFTVKYRPGATNAADSLSRLSCVEIEEARRNLAEEYVCFVARHAVPNALLPRDVETASMTDKELATVRKCIQTGNWNNQPIDKQYITVQSELSCVGNIVLRGTRLVMPSSLRKQTLMLAHEGHQGIVKTKQRLRSKVWWPGMDKSAEAICKTCHECQLVGAAARPEPLITTPLPNRPWEYLAVDLMGPFPTGESVLVVVDYYSRFFEIAIMKSTTTSVIIDRLDDMFARHGVPLKIKSDNGPQFVSDAYRCYLQENGIEQLHSTPLWPQANGEVERQNRTILKAIRTAHATGGNWRRELNKFLLAYRVTPHTTTGVAPAELMFGRALRTKLPEMSDPERTLVDKHVRRHDSVLKMKGKRYADRQRRASPRDIEIGGKVLLKQTRQNKLTTNFESEPYDVIGRNGSEVVIERDGAVYKRNASHLKNYLQDTGDQHVVTDAAEPIAVELDPQCDDQGHSRASAQPSPRKSTRDRKAPAWQDDFVVN